jgi:hypothetical protein
VTRGPEEKWHVDKGIPLALMLSLAATTCSGIWYAALTSARINRLEEKIAEQVTFRDDIITLKIQVQNLTRLTERVEALLERRSEIPKSDRMGGLQ